MPDLPEIHVVTQIHKLLLPKLQHQTTRFSDLNWYRLRAHTHTDIHFRAHTLNTHLEGFRKKGKDKKIKKKTDTESVFTCVMHEDKSNENLCAHVHCFSDK